MSRFWLTEDQGAIREGVAFNRPLRVVGTDVHNGDLPAHGQLVGLSPVDVILCGWKKAEDDEALILRLFNPTETAVAATFKLNSNFLPKPVKVDEVDLIERPVAKSKARLAGNTVSVNVPARGIASVRVGFGSRKGGRAVGLRSVAFRE